MKTTIALLISLFVFFTSSLAQQNQIDHWEMLVDASGIWRYFPGTLEPPANWRTIGFDDSSWAQGPGGIGYGDNDDATIISSVTSLYMRQAFYVADPADLLGALLFIDYDDAFVAYLNGVEIARANIGITGQIPTFNTFADGNHEALMYQGGEPESFMVNHAALDSILVLGNNMLAIQIHNYGATSSDMSAIPYFFAGITSPIVSGPALPSWFDAGIFNVSSHLPLLIINTNGQTIQNDPRIIANLKVINNGAGNLNFLVDAPTDYDGQISIEIRGMSSQGFPKKSYSFETQNPDTSNNNVSLLGMPEENDWVLYGPYSDKTLLRNVITYMLAREMGNWASHTEFCELYLNQQYQGLYVMMEKVKPDDDRVDIDKLDLDDNAGDSLTGGYMLKIDWRNNGPYDWISPVVSFNGNYLDLRHQFEYPDREDITLTQGTYIENYVTNFETNLIDIGFTDPQDGYRKYIDVHSFIDFFIVNEITNNIDGYRLSTFLTKVRDSRGGKLFAGPVWDFNLGFGNANYGNGWLTSGWALYNPNVIADIPFYWKRLEEDPKYLDLVRCRWDQLRQTVLDTTKIMNQIDSLVNVMGDAIDRNFTRWNVLGSYVWPNYYVGSTYQEEVAWMKNWIKQRLDWIDNNLQGSASYCESFYADKIIVSEINYNPGAGFSTGDWFELNNISNAAIDLSGWVVKDEDNLDSYTIPNGFLLDSGQYLVLAYDKIQFAQFHPLVFNSIGDFGWKLGSNDQVRVYDRDGWLVCSVDYDNNNGWPEEADGDGPTLEVLDEYADLNNPANWIAGCPGGSPGGPYVFPCGGVGIANSIENLAIQVFPNPASYQIFIQDENEEELKIGLYSMEGRLLYETINSENLHRIDISKIPAGCYHIKIDNGTSSFRKVIVKIGE